MQTGGAAPEYMKTQQVKIHIYKTTCISYNYGVGATTMYIIRFKTTQKTNSVTHHSDIAVSRD